MNETILKPTRLVSLDALRGFDMIWIIGGENVIHHLAKATDMPLFNALAVQMRHQAWEGFHFYDLIMPLFLFMVGMSIPFSLSNRLAKGESKKRIYFHSFKRAIILFLLGMVCQCNLLAFDPDKLYIIHDTLQSIAIGYFFSIVIYTTLKPGKQLLLTFGLLLFYWCILRFVPVPGHEAGILTPESNIAKYVEQLVFGRFDDAPAPYAWFLGSLGFVTTVMTGVFAGSIVRLKQLKIVFFKSENILVHKTIALAGVGLVLVLSGQLISLWYPIIKAIWNPTFVLFSSGLSFLLMALFYYIIDVKGYQRWAFWLKVIGMNSIAVYMSVHLIDFEGIANNIIYGTEQFVGVYYSTIKTIAGLLIIYGLLYFMYKKSVFIKV